METIHRLGLCLALLFLTLFSSNSQGQKQIPYVNSVDSISLGIDYADTGAYAKASSLYETVSENDTNYVLALLEDAVAKESTEEDSTAILLCRKGIAQATEYTPDFYNTLASVYMDEGSYSDAVSLLRDTVLPKYSNIHKLYFTLGLAQYKMHNYADAITTFQKCIDLDIYDAVSHYYLGRCCLEQGRLIPALLSLQFYLVLQPQTNRSYTTIGLIEQMTGNKYQYNKSYAVNPSQYHDSAFTELDLLIRSKIAMNREYPAATDINYNFVKQIQLLLEQLKYIPNTGNYWMEKYVPFFTGIQQRKFLEPYMYFIMASVSSNDESLQKGIIKNKKKIKEFAKYADGLLTTQRSKKEIMVDGKKVQVTCYYFDNNMIQSMGPENSAGKSVGDWTTYYRHSGALYIKGKYNDNGEREGKWQWFYNSGALKETDTYVNGKREDTSKLWYENGAPKAIYYMHNDMLDGSYKEFNNSGILSTSATYKQDKLTGPATYYYDDGKLHYTASYVDGKFEGQLKEFYISGQLKSVKTMQNNMKNGSHTNYWSNGKVKETGDYKDDKQIGHWKIYSVDGHLQKEGDFNQKGDPIGKWVFYFRNGKKDEVEPFSKNGEIDGIDSLFDKDGIVYEIQNYKAGVLQSYEFKDKSGKNITSGKIDGKTLAMNYFTPQGVKKTEGLYIDNKKEGEWKYYDYYGKLATTENFYHDKLDGVTTYYYSNGKVKDSAYYTDDEKDGYYVSYHINGKMDIQGWFVNGNKEGDWNYYDLKGNLIKHYFYANGNLHGHSDFYDAKGLLSEQHFYRYGYIDKIFLFDSTGTHIVYKYISDKGNGKYLYTYDNGNTSHEFSYVNGSMEGPEKRYFYNGKPSSEGSYLQGDLQGPSKGYYDNGNLRYSYTYDIGNCEDTGRSYYRNGNLEEVSTYLNGELDGMDKHYFENGKQDAISNYSEGELDGEYTATYDNITGGIFWLENGNIIAYSSADKDGKPLKRINLDNGTGDVTAYFPNGNKSIVCRYENGELVGKDLNYAPDGKVVSDKNYELGYRQGVQKYYYDSDTTLKEEDTYYYGDLDGPSCYYYKNGKLEHIEYYVLGSKTGTWRYYDEKGKLLKTAIYYDGVEITETASK